jgi:hypothetical protein
LSPRKISWRNSIDAPRAAMTEIVHERRGQIVDLERADGEDQARALGHFAMG